MGRIHSRDESKRDQKDCMYWPEWIPLISVEWLLLASTTSIKPTEWIYVIISSRAASLVLCHGLVLLAVAYFHIYLQELNVIFQLGFQSFKISFPNHNLIYSCCLFLFCENWFTLQHDIFCVHSSFMHCTEYMEMQSNPYYNIQFLGLCNS